MKCKPLSNYLNLINSALDKQDLLNAKRYGEIALKKISTLSYSPLEEYLLYSKIGDVYSWLAEYSHSLDMFYKASLTASKHHLNPAYIAYTSYMMGSNFLSIRNINRALYQFQKVEQYYKKHGAESFPMDKITYCIALIGLGYCYMSKNNLEKIEEIIKKKLPSIIISLKDETASGLYYHLKGEYLMALKEYDNARKSFQEYIKINKRNNNCLDHALEGGIHIATIDLLEGNLESATQSLKSLLKEAYHLKIDDMICKIGFLLSKCYTLNNMPAKSIAIEKSIKPFLNKLDIVWLYEQTREFEQLYRRLQSIYQSDVNHMPLILERTIQHHYELSDYRHTIIGQSAPMIEVYQLIEKIAPTDLPVLIQGETGTGKELVARAIHQNSGRREKSWLALNCGAVPETLLENELFGHCKGAFTDAREDKKGYIELSSEGTLFLDEIGDMSPAMQQKLLRVLEEKLVWHVGGQKAIPINTRFIFASNQDIEKLVKRKLFRQELYYRINTIIITLPPLRDRKEDIPLLINHFLTKYASHKTLKTECLTPNTLDLLTNYSWPGNVRELENEIERICTLYPHIKQITESILSESIRNYLPNQKRATIKELTNSFQIKIIKDMLKKNKGKIIETARELGFSRIALYKRMKQLKIESSDICKLR